jgi:hypothetical protein
VGTPSCFFIFSKWWQRSKARSLPETHHLLALHGHDEPRGVYSQWVHALGEDGLLNGRKVGCRSSTEQNVFVFVFVVAAASCSTRQWLRDHPPGTATTASVGCAGGSSSVAAHPGNLMDVVDVGGGGERLHHSPRAVRVHAPPPNPTSPSNLPSYHDLRHNPS